MKPQTQLQLTIDNSLLNLPAKPVHYAEVDNDGSRVGAASEATESPWRNDYYFIAPPL